MGYINSVIELQKDGLYRATIRYSWMYMFTQEEHNTFRTISDCRLWLLEQRCENLIVLDKEEDQEVVQENCETENVIEGNCFSDSDSDSENLILKKNRN